MSGIPVKKLSVEDELRIYRDLFREKPARVKVDPREDTLEDRLKQKEAIEKEHKRKNSKAFKIFIAGFLGCFVSLISPAIFLDALGFMPYKNDQAVVEYLDKKEKLKAVKYDKSRILEDSKTKNILEGVYWASIKDRISPLENAINAYEKDIKMIEERKEVAGYNYFRKVLPIYLGLGALCGLGLVLTGVFYADRNNKNKKRELKALGF